MSKSRNNISIDVVIDDETERLISHVSGFKRFNWNVFRLKHPVSSISGINVNTKNEIGYYKIRRGVAITIRIFPLNNVYIIEPKRIITGNDSYAFILFRDDECLTSKCSTKKQLVKAFLTLG